MIWISVLIWVAAFVMWVMGVVILYQATKADFTPWKSTKRRLVIAGILVVVPVDIWIFHILPIQLAVVASLVVTCVAVFHNVMILPEKLRRALRKKK
jgi:hypothetical protein